MIVTAVLGVVVGAVAMLVTVVLAAPRLMIRVGRSTRGFDETVETVVEVARGRGWSVPIVHRIDESVAKAGHTIPPAAIVELCHPDLAGQILREPRHRFVTSMMPCRVGVWQNEDGEVVVARMNTALMSRMFGGLIAAVMARATRQSESMVAPLLAP